MTKLEEAAKAHYERLHYTRWENLTPSTRDGFLAAMRAAVEALREPTKKMIEAGEKVVDGQFDPWDPGQFRGVDDLWPAMVDAILSEGE